MIQKMVRYIMAAKSDKHRLKMELEKLKGQLDEMDQNAEEDIITWVRR